MSDHAPSDAPAVSAPPAAARPRRTLAWLWVLVFPLLALLIWAYLQQREGLRSEQQRLAIESEQRATLDALRAEIDALRRGLKALETRASDNAATNQVLREELLGMGERAALLEDAVARLADNRLRGEVMLRLNEAEFLLLMGEERLRLFADVPATLQAYTLADAALAGLDDPVLATTRQTLAQEIAALRAIDPDPRPALRTEIARLTAGIDRLPASRSDEVEVVDRNDSRLVQLLGQLVKVRRVADRDAILGPVQRETLLAALRLQLELAQAALARPDPAAYLHAIAQADALTARLFDGRDAAVVELRAALQRLREAPLRVELPVLGATLQELRGLRAARSAAPVSQPESTSESTPESTPSSDGTGE